MKTSSADTFEFRSIRQVIGKFHGAGEKWWCFAVEIEPHFVDKVDDVVNEYAVAMLVKNTVCPYCVRDRTNDSVVNRDSVFVPIGRTNYSRARLKWRGLSWESWRTPVRTSIGTVQLLTSTSAAGSSWNDFISFITSDCTPWEFDMILWKSSSFLKSTNAMMIFDGIVR